MATVANQLLSATWVRGEVHSIRNTTSLGWLIRHLGLSLALAHSLALFGRIDPASGWGSKRRTVDSGVLLCLAASEVPGSCLLFVFRSSFVPARTSVAPSAVSLPVLPVLPVCLPSAPPTTPPHPLSQPATHPPSWSRIAPFLVADTATSPLVPARFAGPLGGGGLWALGSLCFWPR